ncbi:3'5'-cyclic nucleotide phosphodiesterase [Trichuris suis]|nr:3'5'-cyclic nucleotide phosphodiesterase [Trichuris suis]
MLLSGGCQQQSLEDNASRGAETLFLSYCLFSAEKKSSKRSKDAFEHGEDLIVTPFAQVLATLRNVRENIVALTQSADKASTSTTLRPSQVGPSSGPTEASSAVSSGTAAGGSMPDEATQHLAESTLMELDWCLEQLEAIQTHRSVSEMTSSKFRKMLTKELSQFSDSKSGDQLSRFIFSTFMGHDDDLELASEKQKQITDSIKESDEEKAFGASSKLGKTKQHVTSAMSHISGVHKLRKSPTTNAEETVAAALSDSTLMACTCTGSKFTPELENAIGEIDRWGMDVFKFHRLCDSHSLTTVTFTVMKNRGLIREFRINTTMLLTYLLHLEDHYRQNSYHNSIHATDVTQTVHVMFSAPSLNSVFTDLEKFAVIFAAAIHDVDHPGLTNQFLVNSGSELAIMYNDESVLEQHHLAVAFKLLQEPDCDILTGLSQKQRQLFRRIVIDTVLATDMSKHMSLLADLKTMVETKKLSGPGLPKLEKYGDRIQVLQNLIHIADLSNPSKPLPLYEQWVDRLLEEYWGQGDKEKELGFEVSPMCDRQNVSREKSQVGFIDYIVHPLMETWADLVYPDGQQILDQLEQNRNNFFVRLTEKDQEEFPVTT